MLMKFAFDSGNTSPPIGLKNESLSYSDLQIVPLKQLNFTSCRFEEEFGQQEKVGDTQRVIMAEYNAY